MGNELFKKSPLTLAVSLALKGMVVGAPAAYAQEEAASAADGVAGQIDEIVVVRGIRSSLKRSMDLKRSRDGVVDAITAEDIGDFPDGNLAESLQRITGVSIDRERGEGARVTVRGFGPQFNLVLLNGRQLATSDIYSRSFDFGNLASEGIAAVEVYKSGQADVPTGGIGSTINIRTTRPLDAPGMQFTAAASGMHDDSTEKGSSWTGEMSALFSNTFADDTFGVALSAVRQTRNSGGNQGQVDGWRSFQGDVNNCWCGVGTSEWGGIPIDDNQINRTTSPDEVYSVPQAISYHLHEYDRVRTNGQLTLQWQASERVEATLDYTYSELELDHTYNNLSSWFNFGGQETVWTDGPLASPIEYTENLPGSDFSMTAGEDAFLAENGALGLNLLWEVTDRLSVELDHHSSSAERKPNSRFGVRSNFSIAAYTRDRTSGYFGKELPILQLGLRESLTPDDMQVTGSVFENDYSKMDIDQTRVAGTFDADFGFVDGIDFGIELTEVGHRSAHSLVQRNSWSAQTERGAIADLLTPASMADSFDEIPGGDDQRRQTDFFTFDMAQMIERMESLMASGDAPTVQLPDMGPCGTGLCASENYTTDLRTVEESTAAYFQVNLSFQAGALPIDMRVGLRYEQTDVTSRALSPAYTTLRWESGNELTPVLAPNPEFTQLEGDYDVVLPNVDFKIDLRDDLVGRISYSETITRPGYNDIRGGQAIFSPVRIGGGLGARGNPALLPFESSNWDLSLEWYYGDDSYVAAGYFHKDVENFIGTSSVVEPLFNLPHPALGPLGEEARQATGSSDGGALYTWILENRADAEGVNAETGVISGVAGRDPASPFNLTVPVNIQEASMKGWEFVVQHTFGDSGFGAIVNATLVEADVGYDNFNLMEQFVLTGLSDSANVIAFYDKNDISVRLAYNWRDEHLAGTGQNNVGSGPPTRVAPYQQLDMSASYWFTERMQVYLDVLNMTNETRHLFGRHESQTLYAVQEGTRYNIGFRYKF